VLGGNGGPTSDGGRVRTSSARTTCSCTSTSGWSPTGRWSSEAGRCRSSAA